VWFSAAFLHMANCIIVRFCMRDCYDVALCPVDGIIAAYFILVVSGVQWVVVSLGGLFRLQDR